MSDRAERIESALAERRARPGGIAPAPTGPVPLSPVQRSLWIMSQLAKGDPVNARPMHLRIQGALDVSVLEVALTDVIDRHSILRTTFPMVEGEPVQVVSPTDRIRLETIDMGSEPDPEAAARARTRAHGSTVFDLTKEVPFRPILLRLGVNDHVLSVAMHHIVFDGWSEGLFVDDLIAFYDARLDGEDAHLPELTVQVRDVALWLAARTDETRIEEQLAWWVERLADLPPDLELPVDRPPLDSKAVESVELDLGVSLTERVQEFASAHDATPFMVLLAGLQVLVTRLTGQDDVVVTVPSAGRQRPEMEPLIGCFIDTIAVRSTVDLDAGFGVHCGVVRGEVLASLAHTDAPYSRVMGAVRPWTGGDREPLSRVHFQLRNFPGERGPSRHVSIETWGSPLVAGSHLAVRAERTGESLVLSFIYDRKRFRAESIREWAEGLERLLTAGLEDPELPAGRLPLLGDRDRTLVEGKWDGPAARPESPGLPAERLRAVAVGSPDSIAFETGDRHITYGEFDGLVDRAAAAILERGLGAGDAIVLFLDRGLDTAIAIFAALRAGVAYVPVDADLASQWLQTVLEQVNPGFVLTRSALRSKMGDLPVPVLNVGDLVAEGQGRPDHSPAAEDLAYVLFTSGSTGLPKGVLVEQGSLAAFLVGSAEIQRVGPGDRVAWFSSISFDGLTTNLHSSIIAGATVVIRDEDVISSIPRFLAWCEARQISHLRLPTSFGHVMLDEMVSTGATPPSTLRVMTLGGEQARADVIEAWRQRFGTQVQLWNNYGPTETTVWVTTGEMTAAPAPHQWVPVGRPMRSVRVRIRDTEGAIVPVGVAGELYLGGPLVSRGYLDSPELTESRFETDEQGVRWYRSGDLGRWLRDGQIEVLGRIDRQVKIRGYRVEPAEIEVVLRDRPEVDDAVVVARPGIDGELSLHAYVVSSVGTDQLE